MEKELSEKTKKQLEGAGVGIVYLFGSQANGTAMPQSDYDIGVVFAEGRKTPDDPHGALYGILSEDFPDYIDGPRLDISFLQRANAGLAMSAISRGKVLFETNSKFRADYEESVVHQYDDYFPLKKEYEEATFRAFTNV